MIDKTNKKFIAGLLAIIIAIIIAILLGRKEG